MCAVLEAGIFADFLVVFIPRQVHSQNRVVVIRAREFSNGVGD